jgi:hypothetical protein
MTARIVVLGMHRSGTSCVGELLAAMGTYFGPPGMGTGGNIENPRGLFERRDLCRLCQFILHQARTDLGNQPLLANELACLAGCDAQPIRTTQPRFASAAQLSQRPFAKREWLAA